MNWKLWVAIGALAGGVAYAARRRAARDLAPGSAWAEVTDPVTRFGG